MNPAPPIRRVISTLADVVAESSQPPIPYGADANGPHAAARILAPLIERESVEIFCVLLLDARRNVTGYAEISRGTLTSSMVHPREVFGPAVRLGAGAIIVAHNHPSGDPEPSREDIEVTTRLVKAGAILGIPVLDHIVIGANGAHRSLRNLYPDHFQQ